MSSTPFHGWKGVSLAFRSGSRARRGRGLSSDLRTRRPRSASLALRERGNNSDSPLMRLRGRPGVSYNDTPQGSPLIPSWPTRVSPSQGGVLTARVMAAGSPHGRSWSRSGVGDSRTALTSARGVFTPSGVTPPSSCGASDVRPSGMYRSTVRPGNSAVCAAAGTPPLSASALCGLGSAGRHAVQTAARDTTCGPSSVLSG